ncbi:MAG: ATP-dependent helicase, partial [Pyrinomonadaceae bacterium]|nr:ATP-dependent helicase [Pyrinomonadaceae bacterium]
LGLAKTSIANNRKQFPKMLTAVRRSRAFKPAMVPCSDVEQQSAFVASRILELRDEGTGLEDIAVMYRSHYHSIELQLELSRRNIPYRVQSGIRFFEQAHIKDVISYLRIIINPRDELAWKRILKMIPGVGNKTANRVFEQIMSEPPALAGGSVLTALTAPDRANTPSVRSDRLRSSQPWLDFVRLLEMLVADENRNNPTKQIEIILANGYEQYLQENFENADARIEDLRGLASYSNRYTSTEEFLSELALISTERFKEPQPLVGEEVIEGGEDDELLTLTSVHQAKGLEWKAVFIIWAAEGKFPSPKSLREIDSEEEERRLWYVAMTRAKDELYLTYPLLLTDYNRQTVLQKPSRFITECPAALYEIWNLEEEAPAFADPMQIGGDPREFIN